MLRSQDAFNHLMPDEWSRSFILTDPQLPDNPIVFVNDIFLELTGYSKEEAIGINCRFLQGPDSDPKAVRAIREAIHKLEPITVDILNYCKDGSTFWNRLRIRPIVSSSGMLVNFVGVQNPIPASEVRPAPMRGIHE